MPSTPHIFDHKAIRRNQQRIAQKQETFLHDWSLENITERLQVVRREFETSVVSGTRANINAPQLGNIQYLGASKNISPEDDNDSADSLQNEILPLAENSADSFIDILSLHTKNDLPGALIQINRALKPDGLFVGAMFGGETLYELRASLGHAEMQIANGVRPRVYPFADKQQMGSLMQRAGFALPVIDSELIHASYENIYTLMRDIRNMGQSSALAGRTQHFTRKALFDLAGKYYNDNFSEKDGRITATFEIIFLLGWAPHESQQKPLRPGSAEMKLADILDTEEIGTGEKAKP